MTIAPPARRRPSLRRVGRWAISLAAVGFIVWMLPFRDRCNAEGVCEEGLLTTLGHVRLPLVLALLGVYLASTIVWSARWQALLGLAGVDLRFFSTWRVTLEAQAGGILLPGGVGGDALRIAYAKERAPGARVAKVAASIMADRLLGLVTLALVALVLGLAFDSGSAARPLLPLLAGVPLGGAVGWVLVRTLARSEGVRSSALARGKLGQRAVLPFLDYASAPGATRVMLRGLALSVVVSAAQLGVVRGLVMALGAEPTSEASLVVGASFAMIVAAIPAAPGGWGTAEAAYVFFLGRAGVPPAAAAAACLLYRLMWYATGSIGAVSALARADRGERS